MTPGPAYIPCPRDILKFTMYPDRVAFRRTFDVPPGYLWQDATESTGAGWVRPLGKMPICARDNDGSTCGHCMECQP